MRAVSTLVVLFLFFIFFSHKQCGMIRTDISSGSHKERIPRQSLLAARLAERLAQHVANAHSFEKSTVVKNPPHASLGLEEREEHKKGADGIVRCLERAASVDRHIGTLRRMNQHEVVKVVAREEERLAHNALVGLRHARQAVGVPGPEDVGEGSVHGAKVGNQLGLVAPGATDGKIERAWRAYRLLHEVGQRPRAPNVRSVGWVTAGDGASVVVEVVHRHIRVCGRRRQRKEHRQKGVLEQYRLPYFAPLLLLKRARIRCD